MKQAVIFLLLITAFKVNSQVTVTGGADQVTHMPQTSLTITATATGSPTTIQWTKLSGSSSGVRTQEGKITSPTSLTTTITNIGVAVYTYEIAVSNGTTTAKDTVTVTGYGQRSRTPNPNFEKFVLTPFSNQYFYTNIMNNFPTLNGGDTLVLSASTTGVAQFYGDDGSGGWGGDSLYPVVIINPPNQQINIAGAFRCNGQYIKITGSGSVNHKYGFKLSGADKSGFVFPARASDIEIERVESDGGDNSIYCKSQIDSTNVLTYHPNWYFKNLYFHDLKFQNTGGESMYIGHTFTFDQGQPTTGYIPVKMKDVLITRDTIINAGWDGIQISNTEGVTITHNYVNGTGGAGMSSQQYGIIFGGYASGRLDSNTVLNTRSSGLAIFGYGDISVKGNRLKNNGFNAGGSTFAAIYINDNQIGFIGTPSPRLRVLVEDNCIEDIPNYSGGAAIRSADGNNTTLPSIFRNNRITDALSRPFTNTILSQGSGDTIAGNAFGACFNLPTRKYILRKAGRGLKFKRR